MAAPPAYLDECIDRPVADALGERGFDVLTAIEAGQGEKLDEEQLQFALSLGRVLLTYDRSDFRRLHATYLSTGRHHGGIVAIPQVPPVSRRQLRAALMLDWLGTLDEHRSRMFQWNDLQGRLLSGLRLSGYSEDEINEAVGGSQEA
jgi:predicted nuclease of predicted toxin-antitoxin system